MEVLGRYRRLFKFVFDPFSALEKWWHRTLTAGLLLMGLLSAAYSGPLMSWLRQETPKLVDHLALPAFLCTILALVAAYRLQKQIEETAKIPKPRIVPRGEPYYRRYTHRDARGTPGMTAVFYFVDFCRQSESQPTPATETVANISVVRQRPFFNALCVDEPGEWIDHGREPCAFWEQQWHGVHKTTFMGNHLPQTLVLAMQSDQQLHIRLHRENYRAVSFGRGEFMVRVRLSAHNVDLAESISWFAIDASKDQVTRLMSAPECAKLLDAASRHESPSA